MNFLACEFSESGDGSKRLLSEMNMESASRIDGYETTDNLRSAIFATYKEFGLDHAKGVFEMTVVESFNKLN